MASPTETSAERAQSNRLPDFVKRPVRLVTSFYEGYERALEGIFSAAERMVLLTQTLVNKHPRGTNVVLVGVLSASLLALMIIDDPVEDHLPISKKPRVTFIGSGTDFKSNTLGELQIEDMPVVERVDYSGWNIFRKPGFNLRYPNEEGWRATSNSIIKGPDGDEEVTISVIAQALKGKSFEQFVAEQYFVNKQNRLGIVSSQPANFPAWKAAGLDGEMIGYRTNLRPGGKMYDVRDFLVYINGMVYQLVVSQEISQVQKTDLQVYNILNSLYIAGTSTGSSLGK